MKSKPPNLLPSDTLVWVDALEEIFVVYYCPPCFAKMLIPWRRKPTQGQCDCGKRI